MIHAAAQTRGPLDSRLRGNDEKKKACSVKRFLFFLFLSLFMIASLAARAEDAPEKPKENLAKIEKQMEAQKATAASLDAKKQMTATELRDLQAKLVAATDAFTAKQAEQDALEERLAALEAETDKRTEDSDKLEARFRDLSGLLLRLSRLPPALFLFQPEDGADQFHRALLVRALLPRLKAESEALEGSLEGLETSRARLAEQKRLVAGAKQNLAWQRNNLDELVRTRQGSLQKTEEQKAVIVAQLATLADEAKDLRQLMEKVDKASAFSRPKKDFKLRRGMKMPVGGKILRGFGERDADGVASQGLTLAGSNAGPIVAPQDGRVVFAGPFRGYGLIVILEHGGGAHSFLAGFGRVDAEIGQIVEAGEPLGVLPEEKNNARPELYFEWRRGDEPVNPLAP
jgi:septal ring factor EnvC (AmiA/AmiB activator)